MEQKNKKNYIIGNMGEQEATEYLVKNGYKILDKNFKCSIEEIVFIEVKTRNNLFYGYPAESVTNKKLQHIYNTAKYYLHIRNLEDSLVRIDAIEVYIKQNSYKINHIKQII